MNGRPARVGSVGPQVAEMAKCMMSPRKEIWKRVHATGKGAPGLASTLGQKAKMKVAARSRGINFRLSRRIQRPARGLAAYHLVQRAGSLVLIRSLYERASSGVVVI